MNIGIIGSGNMGARMGKIWAAKGHRVLFSFSKARYIEPAGMLCVQLAYGMGLGPRLGMKLLRG